MDISRLNSNEAAQLDSLRISPQQVKANQAANAAVTQDANASIEVPADTVSLDGMAQVTEIVKQAPDMRLDLIASVRAMLDRGEDFSSADIAEALVDGGFAKYFTEK